MTSRGLLFGSVAEEYERFRLGYPERVLDLIRAYATDPLERAFEVGAGTGKATRLIAGAGVHVTCLEPDADMADVLRRTTADLPVTIEQTTFEAHAATQPYDLLYAASAWHWTDPTHRYERAAALLRPRGTFASFGGRREISDPDLDAQVLAARTALVGEIAHAAPISTGDLRWPGDELTAHPSFTDVEQHAVGLTTLLPREAYLGYLGTVSAYLLLGDADRAAVFARIRKLLPDPVEITTGVDLHLARRTDG